jgi:hypothetical protein
MTNNLVAYSHCVQFPSCPGLPYNRFGVCRLDTEWIIALDSSCISMNQCLILLEASVDIVSQQDAAKDFQ